MGVRVIPYLSVKRKVEKKREKDSLATEEMRKVYKTELGPQPVPLSVFGELIDEDNVDDGSDDEMNEENLSENEDLTTEKKPSKTKRVTQVELIERAGRKELQKKEAEARKAEELSKDIDRHI
ncbi:hypothetical protein PTKIN_Ptkin01aG0146700 [Pterospermum kingtungense]